MSHVSQMLRRGAVSLGAFAAGAGFVAGPASAASLPLDLKCKYPLVGVRSVKLTVAGEFPATSTGGIPAIPLTVKLDIPEEPGSLSMPVDETRLVRGSFKLGLAIGTGTLALPVDVLGTFGAGTSVGRVGSAFPAYSLVGQASIPSSPGSTQAVNYDVGSFSASLKYTDAAGDAILMPPITKDINGAPTKDSDGDPTTFDISCKIDPPTQVNRLASVAGVPICPPVILSPNPPGQLPIGDADITSTSVHLRWTASPFSPGDCKPEAASYRVTYGDKTVTVPASQLDTVITGLSPSTSYAFKVQAIGQFDVAGPNGSSFTVNVTTDAVPVAQTISYGYTLAGFTTLNTLTKGTLALKGTIDAKLTLSTGAFTADLVLNQTQGQLIALGFLPVTAKIGFVPSGKMTGSLLDGVLTTNSKVRIKVQEIKLFGAIPLAGGNNCQTKSLSDINLKSTQGEFSPLNGGPIAGAFKISDLNGCGAFNGLVSPLTAGGGNTINLNLTPKA